MGTKSPERELQVDLVGGQTADCDVLAYEPQLQSIAEDTNAPDSGTGNDEHQVAALEHRRTSLLSGRRSYEHPRVVQHLTIVTDILCTIEAKAILVVVAPPVSRAAGNMRGE